MKLGKSLRQCNVCKRAIRSEQYLTCEECNYYACPECVRLQR